MQRRYSRCEEHKRRFEWWRIGPNHYQDWKVPAVLHPRVFHRFHPLWSRRRDIRWIVIRSSQVKRFPSQPTKKESDRERKREREGSPRFPPSKLTHFLSVHENFRAKDSSCTLFKCLLLFFSFALCIMYFSKYITTDFNYYFRAWKEIPSKGSKPWVIHFPGLRLAHSRNCQKFRKQRNRLFSIKDSIVTCFFEFWVIFIGVSNSLFHSKTGSQILVRVRRKIVKI